MAAPFSNRPASVDDSLSPDRRCGAGDRHRRHQTCQERVRNDGVTTIRRSSVPWLDTGRSRQWAAASSIC
jgi:hypothetical protein